MKRLFWLRRSLTETDIRLLEDINYEYPSSITLNGMTRFVVEEGADITISGPLTIRGNGTEAESQILRVDGGKLKLDGVTIKDYALSSDSGVYGIARIQGADAAFTLENVTIENAQSPRGAIYVSGSSGAVTFTVKNSTFKNNKANKEYGGALALYGAVNATIEDSTFVGNTAKGNGGAIQLNSGSTKATVKNCTFTGNSSDSKGDAIYVYGSLTIDGVTMSGNGEDVYVNNGSFALKGDVAMEKIFLAAGKRVALNDTLTVAEAIVIDGTLGQTVLTGSKVADYYTSFTGKNASLTVDSNGVLTEAGEGAQLAESPVVDESIKTAVDVLESTVTPAEPPVVEEAPEVEEIPVVEEVPVVEETPVVEEVPAVEEAPVIEEVLVIEEVSALEEVLVVEEVSAVAETPAAA